MNRQILMLILLCSCFLCSGFTLPPPGGLRKDILTELNKIRESTPGAKERARWRRLRDNTRSILEQAELDGADKYAPGPWNDALDLFARAKQYAAIRSYRKASYLAEKTIEYASLAIRRAKTEYNKRAKAAKRELARLKKAIDCAVTASKDHTHDDGNGTSDVRARLTLELDDLDNAVALGQFKDFEDGVRRVKSYINARFPDCVGPVSKKE